MEAKWNIETLKEHFEGILNEKDKAIKTALEGEREARTLALAEAKEAVKVAEKNAEKWRENANEWRGAMSDREKNFITRREVWAVLILLVTIIIAIYFKK